MNAIVFGVDNSSLSHADNHKNNFLVLCECPTFEINGSFCSPEKGLLLMLVNQTQNFAWVFIIMLIIVIYLLMEKKSLILKPTIKMSKFLTQFFLHSISNGFSATETRTVSSNGNVSRLLFYL